ncbi:MAG: DUF3102 domain-containing protein [Candidatus Nealsonbacteria bacterium]|nr:DUF3102 domain-containing protein [Candidatus Nealsonbacteria bacterium]
MHTVECGRLLTAIKADMRHGEWGPWLEDWFEADASTARRYMKVYAHLLLLGVNQADVPDLPLEELLGLLTKKAGTPKLSAPADEGDEPTLRVVNSLDELAAQGLKFGTIYVDPP